MKYSLSAVLILLVGGLAQATSNKISCKEGTTELVLTEAVGTYGKHKFVITQRAENGNFMQQLTGDRTKKVHILEMELARTDRYRRTTCRFRKDTQLLFNCIDYSPVATVRLASAKSGRSIRSYSVVLSGVLESVKEMGPDGFMDDLTKYGLSITLSGPIYGKHDIPFDAKFCK